MLAPNERAWGAGAKPPEAAWLFEIPPEFLRVPFDGDEGDGDDGSLSPRTCGFVDGVTRALRVGPGFAMLDRLPVERDGYADARSRYLRLCSRLGTPIQQDRGGTLLYDLVDTSEPRDGGEDYVGSRRGDLPFHTDNAWGRTYPDYMGLLCIRAAREGGVLQLVSAYAVLLELQRTSPGLVKALRTPVTFAREHQLTPGEEAHDTLSIVTWSDDGELTFRYLHTQIAPDGLSDDQREAIAAVESILRRPELPVKLALQPGQILLVNNHWVLHNRTRFDNESGRPRYHVRLWLAGQ